MMVISNAIQENGIEMSGNDTEILGIDAGDDVESSEGYIDSDSESNDKKSEDGSDNEDDDNDDYQEDNPVGVKAKSEKVKPKKKLIKKDNKLIAPHRQRRLIHSLLKKAKIYEIRKLTRRINSLKAAKGTEEQRAKKQRKAERSSKEIAAIREFMIDQLTSRTIAVLKGEGEDSDKELWESCESPIKTNDMLQILSTKDGDHTASIAFLRMLSSKDIVCKFQRISKGENLLIEMGKNKSKEAKKNKNKKAKKPSNKVQSDYDTNRTEITNATLIKTEMANMINTEVVVDKVFVEPDDHVISSSEKPKKVERKQMPNDGSNNLKLKSNAEKKNLKKTIENLQKTERKQKPDSNLSNKKLKINEQVKSQKKSRVKRDDFFIDHVIEVSGDEADTSGGDSDGSSEDEFTAPVLNDTPNPDIRNPKKNRMGQRDRKKLLDKKYGRENNSYQRRDFNGRGRGRGSDSGRGRSMGRGFSAPPRGGSRSSRGGFSGDRRRGFPVNRIQPPPKKEVDVNLHPSWQAKQRQKVQQSISGFAGTKITFDD